MRTCSFWKDKTQTERCGESMPCSNPEHDEQLHHRKHPVYYKNGEMLAKTKEELLKEIRSQIGEARGKLWDIYMGFGWKDRIDSAEHGLTLVISYLYGTIQEMEKLNADQKKIEEEKKFKNTMPRGGF